MKWQSERTKILIDKGFRLLRNAKHEIWGCPCGHTQISLSFTHQEGRSDRNDKALISRTLRNCCGGQRTAA